jgi:hypothetical protein
MYPSTDIILLGVVVAFILVLLVVVYQLRRMEKRFAKLMKGNDAKSLDDVIGIMRREILDAKKNIHATQNHLKNVDGRVRAGIRKVEMVRFNPFKDAGGDQSFSIALLDEKHNGVVISSLYARDGVRVYAKPVENGVSTYSFSEEEQHVVDGATKQV